MPIHSENDKKPDFHNDGLTVITLFLMNLVTAFMSAGFVAQSQFKDGIQFLDYLVTAVFGGVIFFALHSLYKYGYQTLPRLDKTTRSKIMGAFICMLALASSLSILSNVGWLSEAPARNAELRENIERINKSADDTIKLNAQSNSLISVATSVKDKFVSAAENERLYGAFCEGFKGGVGNCTDTLKTLAVAAGNAERELLAAKSKALPMISNIRSSKERIRRIQEDEEISFSEKQDIVKSEANTISENTRQIRNNLPAQSVQNLYQSFDQNWDQKNLRAGSSKLSGMLSQPAMVLKKAHDDIRAGKINRIPKVSEKSTFEVIFAQFEAVFMTVLIACLPDCLALALLVFNFFAKRAASPISAASGGGSPTLSSDNVHELNSAQSSSTHTQAYH